MKILVLGFGGNSTPAVSYILKNLFGLINNEQHVDVTFFGCSNNNTGYKDSNIEYCFIKDLFSSDSPSFYRIIRKIFHVIKKDTLCLGWKYVFANVSKLFKTEKFDYVIGASGNFMYMEAAYQYAIKNNIKFIPMYFDSFTNNIGALNQKKRLKYEKKWYEYASNILLSIDDAFLPFVDDRKIVKEFRIPIFEKENTISKNGEYVYGGIFYEKFRPQRIIDQFIGKSDDAESFAIYSSNYKSDNNQTRKNISIHDLVDADKFDVICKNSKAIIVLGNGNNSSSSPSKVMFALSFHKPIIGLNFDKKPKELERYPLFLNGDDSNVFAKVNELYSNAGNFYFDLYKLYADRNPKILKTTLLNLFVK